MTHSDLAISIRAVSKSYRIWHEEKHDTLAEAAYHRLRHPFNHRRPETFWALRDVSFTVKKGEIIGIIGRNGAGKSTLLKIMSRITEPSGGEIDLYGRVGSLLEVGTGFHPELTGRENVYLNGQILGMRKREIDHQFDAIVDFAGIEKFLDTPVKRYSSGMYVRLAFAVAAHLNPEILIIDEVLAVGDVEFQKKCLGKISNVAREGRTVLFVSHNMAAITSLCSRAILLKEGRMVADRLPHEVISEYIADVSTGMGGQMVWNDDRSGPGTDRVRLRAVRIISGGEITGDVDISEEVEIQIDYQNFVAGARVSVSFHLMHHSGVCVFATGGPSAAHDIGMFRLTGAIPGNFLNDGLYSINVYLLLNVTQLESRYESAVSFTVHDTGRARGEFLGQMYGVVRPQLAFRTEQIEAPGAVEALSS